MSVDRLVERVPVIATDELIARLVPPPRFDGVRFANYVPNPAEPSQAAALSACGEFAERVNAERRKPLLRKVFGGSPSVGRGLYLDGGFGVGKTHLLASIWHAVTGVKAYCTFVELTNLVGALGFRPAVDSLRAHRLLAIDEFELDDPGDTTLIGGLLAELTAAGVHVAATSNTLPDKLGEGRFAADDFLREIQTLAARFDVVRVDGPDYRHRGLPDPPEPLTDRELRASAERIDGATLDDFDTLCAHLETVHPAQYGALVDGISAVHIAGLRPVDGQDVALRMVTLADRLYDRAIPLAVSGVRIPDLFTPEMLAGGYRKKYLRATSRLVALSRDGHAAAATK